MNGPEQMRSVEQMCSRVAMANHTRIDELRFLTKTNKLHYEPRCAYMSVLSSQAASAAHVLQLAGGLRPPGSELSFTRSVRRLAPRLTCWPI
jgi:hypothetical protein